MKFVTKLYFIRILNLFKRTKPPTYLNMDPEKQATPSTSKLVSKRTKTSREGSVCSEKSHTKDTKNSGKSLKVKQVQAKEIKQKPAPDMRSDSHLHLAVQKLHDRTKRVKGKLMSMQKPMKMVIPPKSTNPSTKLCPSTTTTPPNTPMETNLTEQEILREIERLQELMKKVRLQNSRTSSASATSKSNADTEIRKSFQSSDADTKVDSETNRDEDSVNPDGNPKRRRDRTRKKKKITDEGQLQELYVSHINQIVNKDSEEKDPKIPHFKHGDNLEEFATKCVEAGLGRIVEAEVRINAKNNHQAFITLQGGPDAMILSMATRRYAMDGDIVKAFIRETNGQTRESMCDLDESIPILEDIDVTIDDPEDVIVNDVEILKKSEESALALRDRAFVIKILKESGNRQFVGSIAFKHPSKHDDGEYYKFRTRDSKAPLMCIPVESCEELLKEHQSDDILGYLFVAQIVKIEENGRCLGKLVAPVGKCGNLEAEVKAILMHNRLSDMKPFEQRFEEMWASPVNIEKSDMENREDLREDCIFTIDPLTARDLDDAVSCKILKDGLYEIGVHISDVTHFLEESSELDELVKLRATSIYLVNEVIHMLPQTLCMKCSLLPNEDKFTFSVFWVMDKDAKVISTRFARSVIRSCTQLAYEHAQKIIDNPNETFTDDDFPTICNGFDATDIVERVKTLNSLAELMRTKRFENGSLSIDKPQFYFHFDPKTGEPTSYEIASRLTANFLIEEFMLLANQSVAQFIYKSFPDIAFLRSHLPPKPSALKNLKTKLNAVGIELDMSTSKTIFDGLKKICGASTSSEVVSVAMNYLLTKPMMRAKYFCSENVDSEADLYHYALAIPIYTHFTSPIRRYPDILVHRLLSAAMKYTPPPKRTHEELHQLARICNEQKLNAKMAGEESCDLYFKRYVNEKKSINLRAVVVDIYRHSVEVIILETGHLICVPFKLQKVEVDASKAPVVIYISEKNSTKPRLELKMFSEVEIKLMNWEKRLTGFFVSPDAKQRMQNDIAAHGPRPERVAKLSESSPAANLNSAQRRKRKRAKKNTTESSKDELTTNDKTE